MRVGFYLVISLVPAGGFFDYFIYPEHFLSFLFIRLSFSVLYLFVYYLSFTEFAKRHSIGLMIFLTEFVAIPIAIMVHLSGGPASPYYAGLNLLILGVGVLFTWSTMEAIATCSLIFLTYVIPILLFDEITDYKMFLNNIYFISFTCVIAMVSCYFSSKLRASDFENRYRLGVAVKKVVDKSKALMKARRMERKMELYRRLASIGQIAAGVAHELNNALNAAISSNRDLKENLEEADNQLRNIPSYGIIKDDIRILSNGMNRAHHVVKNLLTFSKKNSEGFKPDNIYEGIESTLQILNSELRDKIKVHRDFCDAGEVYCDLNQLNQVFFNIIKNSCDAISGEGNIWIKTWKEGNHFYLSFRDDGPGIAKDKLDKIFDPFFTTKDIGKGTGLGLSVSFNIIKHHHGSIKCTSESGKGAEFIIGLPIDFTKEGEDEYLGRSAV